MHRRSRGESMIHQQSCGANWTSSISSRLRPDSLGFGEHHRFLEARSRWRRFHLERHQLPLVNTTPTPHAPAFKHPQEGTQNMEKPRPDLTALDFAPVISPIACASFLLELEARDSASCTRRSLDACLGPPRPQLPLSAVKARLSAQCGFRARDRFTAKPRPSRPGSGPLCSW